MGAVATLQVHHEDRATAERGVRKAVAEVRRLEKIFSLYRDDSALVALNREGILIAPPRDLLLLLGECRRYWELSGGAFDPTVQALWAVYRDHFSRPDHDPGGPPAVELRAALGKVGFQDVTFDEHRIVLGRRGMGLTLNGIAQGYMTDRAVEVLRSAGIERSLVDIGESRVLGDRVDGAPWRIGIADPDEPGRTDTTIEVVDEAVATSGPYGFRFDAEGRFHHLFDPQRGGSAHRYKSVTVTSSTATAADGLSTAFSLLPPSQIERALEALGEGKVRLISDTGKRITLNAPRS
jgi:thiamine biosynthesis lipoprotein